MIFIDDINVFDNYNGKILGFKPLEEERSQHLSKKIRNLVIYLDLYLKDPSKGNIQ